MAFIKCNYHTHNRLCNHATGEAKDYVLKAISLGMEELGLSDHGPIPTSFMPYQEYKDNLCYRFMSYDVFENIYLKELEDVVKTYGDKIKLYRGLEVEYIPAEHDFYEKLAAKLDYLNLGIHYFVSNGKIHNSYSHVNATNVLDYAKNACIAMDTGLFKTLVHPDLFMFSYENINGERKFDEAALTASKMIIESAIKNNVYLEVNCNGLSNSRKYDSSDWLYPYHEFWNLVKTYTDAKIIIGIDAHRPEALDSEDIEKVIAFTKEIGLNVSHKIDF